MDMIFSKVGRVNFKSTLSYAEWILRPCALGMSQTTRGTFKRHLILALFHSRLLAFWE